MKLLIIEDETDLAKSIIDYLTDTSITCEWVKDSQSAIEKIENHDYDCVLLDLMLPDGNGMDILKYIKLLKKQEGVLIISAKEALDDKIEGLELGADDYLTKPFHLSELLARIQSVVRRRNFGSNTNVLIQNEITINLFAKQLLVNDKEVILTKKEFDLLLFLMGNKNRVVSKSSVAEHLSGDLAEMMDNHDFIYAHVKNLKKKLNDAGYQNYLKTIYGTGYKWQG